MKKNYFLTLIPACLVLTGAATEIEDDDHECTSWIVMPELTSGKFSDAVFARFNAGRELLPQDKLAEFERVLNQRHDEALEKARAVLKKGGS